MYPKIIRTETDYATALARIEVLMDVDPEPNSDEGEELELLCLIVDSPTRRQFLARLEKEINTRGVIDVLRKGIKHGAHDVTSFYATPSPDNAKAVKLHACNRFSVTRQLRYSRDETRRALDLGLFINGLPIATFELKNSLTKQTVADAVEQYKLDRDPKEPLFRFGRCVVHFAVDDSEVMMCTELKGKASWFLPFNQGYTEVLQAIRTERFIPQVRDGHGDEADGA